MPSLAASTAVPPTRLLRLDDLHDNVPKPSCVSVSENRTCYDSSDYAVPVPFYASYEFPDILTARAVVLDQPVCIGHGLDVPALGVLSTIVVPTAVGLCIWVSPICSSM